MSRYGECICGSKLSPVWFIEEEVTTEQGFMYVTGRTKRAVSHLCCEHCYKNYTVDDSFDEEWK